MDNTSAAVTLWIPKKLAQVQLGHSPFKYISKARSDDPFHLHTIIFMGDRSDRGDPIPESERGRDRSATSKRPMITAGWNDGRKGTNEVSQKREQSVKEHGSPQRAAEYLQYPGAVK